MDMLQYLSSLTDSHLKKISNRSFYPKLGKRLFDLALALLALVLMSPFFVVITLLIWGTIGRPILFRQIRPGKYCKPFKIIKFRTMTNAVDNYGNLLPDGERLKNIGKFLRNTSLDELPELFNILKGDMSLVGPRPLLMQYINRYSPEQNRRHEVKPGLTGLAQVNGRNLISWEEKFEFDVWYVDHYSFKLDLKIIGKTFKKVIKSEGVSAVGEATMTEYIPGNSHMSKKRSVK